MLASQPAPSKGSASAAVSVLPSDNVHVVLAECIDDTRPERDTDFPGLDDLIYCNYCNMNDLDSEGFGQCAYRYQQCEWEY